MGCVCVIAFPYILLIWLGIKYTDCVLICSVVSDSATPWTMSIRLLCPWDFSGQNNGLGCHSLLQGIFQTQESSSSLLHWILLPGNPGTRTYDHVAICLVFPFLFLQNLFCHFQAEKVLLGKAASCLLTFKILHLCLNSLAHWLPEESFPSWHLT